MIVSFIGTGLMGLPMAQNLARAGFNLIVWNRTHAKAEPLLELGATLATTANLAIAEADIIISMLENCEVQEQVLLNDESLACCKPGALIIDMASLPPERARQHALKANEFSLSYIDAPVSGGTRGAQEASLVIMAGGETNDINRAAPLFNAMGSKLVHIGPAGCGQIAKCANQAIVGITIGAVSEALLLAEQGGADPAAVRQALLGGFAASKILEQHGERMLIRNFTPGATSRVQLKDLATIDEFARSKSCSLPFTTLAMAQYQALVEDGCEELDHSALFLLLEKACKKQPDTKG
ncbi:MAG: NAD(P)-dependent oxidoreductase [Pseudomonadales bacterium]